MEPKEEHTGGSILERLNRLWKVQMNNFDQKPVAVPVTARGIVSRSISSEKSVEPQPSDLDSTANKRARTEDISVTSRLHSTTDGHVKRPVTNIYGNVSSYSESKRSHHILADHTEHSIPVSQSASLIETRSVFTSQVPQSASAVTAPKQDGGTNQVVLGKGVKPKVSVKPIGKVASPDKTQDSQVIPTTVNRPRPGEDVAVTPTTDNQAFTTKTNKKKPRKLKDKKNQGGEHAPWQNQPPKQMRPIRTILLGEIVKIVPHAKGEFGFIRSFDDLPRDYENKEVHFYLDKISAGQFPISQKDTVSFVLNAHHTDRPSAVAVSLVKCGRRSDRDIKEYLSILNDLLLSNDPHVNDVDCSTTIVGLLHCPAVFKCFGETELETGTILLLISTLITLRSRSKSLENYLKSCLLQLMKSNLMNPNTGRFKHYVQNLSHDPMTLGLLTDSKDLFEFIQMIVELVPDKARAMVSLMKPMLTCGRPLEELLYSLLKTTSRSTSDDPSDMEWDELPLVPSVRELVGDPAESLSCLQPVVCIGPYKSAADYMDTYFRLLRSDCFGALQVGVHKLACGEEVDQRDMKVYFGIKLAGIYLPQREGGFAIAVQFMPKQKNIKWSSSSNLMFGNLLCISVSGTFRDPIWATVCTRDVKVLEKSQTIFVELCTECNTLSDADVVALLCNSQGRGVMVESPTYYKAYQPVLAKLQSIDPETLPFQEELIDVTANRDGELNYPKYITDDTTIKPSKVFDGLKADVDVPLSMLETIKGDFPTTLDEYQLVAVLHMIQNRVALVQGPPGTGKTFIGIKLLLALLTLSTVPDKPILVVTYKNHALDEFLKDVVHVVKRDQVIRIGGRSQDPELAECNMANILRQRKTEKELFSKIREKKDEIFSKRQKLVGALQTLMKSRSFHPQLLIDYFEHDQLFDFVEQAYKQTGHKSKRDAMASILGESKENFKQSLSQSYILSDIFHDWYPDHYVVTQVEVELGLTGWSVKQKTDQDTLTKTDADLNELYNEQDIEDMQKERISAAAATAHYQEINDVDLYKLTDTPGSTPKLFSSSKSVVQQLPVVALMNVQSLWELPKKERVKLVQCLLIQASQQPTEEFQTQLKQYQHLCLEKEELEMQNKIKLLSSAKVIGVTITGASIYQRVLAEVKPAIVLVEEAAEILEPQLIASLGPWVQHLIMIGDHKQLRPNVENYRLVTDYHLDVSMMERFIMNKMPFRSLGKQNRMRPEISRLLHDIYPNLQDNLTRVEKNEAAKCLSKSMYFWSHTDEETAGRSYTNEGEAVRVINLALFLMQQGNRPESITILAAYQGQVALLRRKIRQAEVDHKTTFQPV